MKYRKIRALLIYIAFLVVGFGILQGKTVTGSSVSNITAKSVDTVSILDMPSSNIKHLKATAYNKHMYIRKKIYKKNNKLRTSVLIQLSPKYYGNNDWSMVSVKYYDEKVKKHCVKRVKVNFKSNFNRGVDTVLHLTKGRKKCYSIKNNAVIQEVTVISECNPYDTDESIALAETSVNGLDIFKTNIFRIETDKKAKLFTIVPNNIGRGNLIIDVDFTNGESYSYEIRASVKDSEGCILVANKKVIKDDTLALFYSLKPYEKMSIKGDSSIISTKLQENKKDGEAILLIKGLNKGNAVAYFTCLSAGEKYLYRYNITVAGKSGYQPVKKINPTEKDRHYLCIAPITDAAGNQIESLRNVVITPGSKNVHNTIEYYSGPPALGISSEGTYHIAMEIKDLYGNVVSRFTRAIIANPLRYSDAENIVFHSKAAAKKYFCSGTWDDEWRVIRFYKDRNIEIYDGSGEPWLLRYGDIAAGKATYNIDIHKKLIIVKDYKITHNIPYQIISQDHVRFTIEGETLDFIHRKDHK